MREFIEYKQSVEKERPILTAEPRLIAIEGVDGVGKSIIAKMICEKLREKYGYENVVILKINRLKGGPKQEKLKELAQAGMFKGQQLKNFYVAGTNRAYEESVIPPLAAGKIVILDRSELDLLLYSLEHGQNEDFEQRKKYIQEGTPTHRILAGNRVFIESSDKDIWKNLQGRGNLSEHDPHSLEEVACRQSAMRKVGEIIAQMPHQGNVNIIRVENKRIETSNQNEYLDQLVESITKKINLGNSPRTVDNRI